MRSTMQDVPLLLSRILTHGTTVHGRSRVSTWTGEDGPRRRSFAEIGSREAIREAVLHGVGGSLFPRGEAERHPDLRVVELRGVDTTIDEYVYYLKARRHSPAIDAFLACILPAQHAAHDAMPATRQVNAR